MEAAIQTVVKVFLKSAKGKESMNGGDFDSLVHKQLGNVLSDTDSKGALKEMRKGLDDNQDGKVNFTEYMKLIGYLATSMSETHLKTKDQAGEAGETAVAAAEPASSSPEAAAAAAVPAVTVSVAAPANDEKKKKTGVTVSGGNLGGVNLSGGNLGGVNLSGGNLSGGNLSGGNLSDMAATVVEAVSGGGGEATKLADVVEAAVGTVVVEGEAAS